MSDCNHLARAWNGDCEDCAWNGAITACQSLLRDQMLDGVPMVDLLDTLRRPDDGPKAEESCQACLDATGGGCPAHAETECTCYELTGGHQPGCALNHPRQGGTP